MKNRVKTRWIKKQRGRIIRKMVIYFIDIACSEFMRFISLKPRYRKFLQGYKNGTLRGEVREKLNYLNDHAGMKKMRKKIRTMPWRRMRKKLSVEL